MTVEPGTRLGPYEITARIGVGGMGEVYRARDTRLGRDVAVKVLPAAFSFDPERLARFEQEARATAALNHPNILAVYDIGVDGGSPYIVSELLEGDTLRERISGLPVQKSIDCGIQIAHGLAAAHEKGIVHRDLKPENIFITNDGRVKILDFGLAKLTQVEPAPAGASELPTTPAAGPQANPGTITGVVLGTIGYMSPEQVRGRPADPRADIFALGAILYEMLTGTRAFRGETPIDTMTAMLKEHPPDTPLIERQVSPALRRVVDRCLEKMPSARFQSASDLAFALDAIAEHSSSALPAMAGKAPASRSRAWSPAVVAAVAAVVAAALTVGVLRMTRSADETAPRETVVRFPLLPPDGTVFNPRTTARARFSVSPDGRQIAFVAETNTVSSLWVRPLDSPAARELSGTRGVLGTPIWSPDSGSLAFFSDGKIRRASLMGAAPQVIADLPGAVTQTANVGGSWGPDGTILFTISSNNQPIFRVSADGRTVAQVTRLVSGTRESHDRPSFLPDGRHFLFSSAGPPDRAGVWLGTLDGGDPVRLIERATQAIYALGNVVFIRDGLLQAQLFDLARNQLTGEARPMGEPTFGVDGLFSASQTGVLAYVSGIVPDKQFVWVDRNGRDLGKVQEPAPWGNFDLSPDGTRVVAGRGEGLYGDIWLIDLTRSVETKLTFSGAGDGSPVWSPDGQRIAFTRNLRTGECHAVLISPTGGAETVAYVNKERGCVILDDWSPDGRFITFNRDPSLMALPLTGDRTPFPYVQTANANLDESHFSPDGKWIAYNSNESGTWQVYLAPFPPQGERWQISAGGGVEVRWRGDGRELYYLTLDGQMMAVDVGLGSKPTIGQARMLFQSGITVGTRNDQYAVSNDGQRFLLRRQVVANGRLPLNVVLNWHAELR